MTERKVDYLKRVPLFARCSKAELACLARNSDEIDLPAGKVLIEEGRPNHTFFVLLGGEATVAAHGQTVDRLGPGDVFGEITMMDPGPATATVTTATPVEVLLMSHAQFHSAIRAQETIALRVMAVMAGRLRTLGQHDVAR